MNNMVPQVADMFAHILANSAAAFSKLFIIAYRLYSHNNTNMWTFTPGTRTPRSTPDAVTAALHYSLSYLERRIPTLGYSLLATARPSMHKFTHKLLTLGLQHRRPLRLNTLFTHDCVPTHEDNIPKFANDTAVIGRITKGR